jgi:hypothetical protein
MRPLLSGSIASSLTLVKVGNITNRVMKRAKPTSTWLGGAVGVPRPERMKPSTIRMRVKPVTVKSSAGTSEMPPISSRSWTAFEPSGGAAARAAG